MVNLRTGERIGNLSKGMRERLQLILVMSRKALLYVFDEPIAAVDPAARDYILETILRNYNEEGAVLISTHLIADIESLMSNVIFLKNGEIVLQGEADALRGKSGLSVDQMFREAFKC
jgi:ABC-2 type transport system ATP-binding protein